MKRALLVHGCCELEEFYNETPSPSNSPWFPWLQKQLLLRDVEAQTPEMPRPFQPNYRAWKRVLDTFRIDSQTVLAGHSCGGGFILRYLTEEKISPLGIFLVAPWLDSFKRRSPFLDFALDAEIAPKLKGLHILYSDDDATDGAAESVDNLLNACPEADYHRFRDKGHFTADSLGGPACPELLEIIVSCVRLPARR